MSWCCAIRFELVIRLFFITLQISDPVFCKMFRNSPVIFSSPSDYTVNDPSRSHTIFFFFCHIGNRQKCFYSMHICINSTIIIHHCKFCIPGIAGKSFLLIPCIIQKFLRARSSCQNTGSCRQNNECMRIALLVWQNLIFRSKSCIPASVFLIMKFSTKPFQGCVNQRFASLMSQKSTNAVYMSHTTCDPRLTIAFCPGSSVISQIIRRSARRWEFMSET